MKNVKWIAAILVISSVFCGTLALAQPKATRKPAKPTRTVRVPTARTSDRWARTRGTIEERLRRYVYSYKPSDEQKAKLEKVLKAQEKDLADFDKTRGPKIKAIDDEIAVVNKKIDELKKELDTIQKRKTVYSKARAELLIDHKAEIDNVFTQEQKIASIVNRLRTETVYRYWAGLPKDVQTKLNEQFEAAALKVIQADPAESEKVLYQVRREMRDVVNKTVTPEHRQAGELKYMMDSTIRRFYRVKLTDEQVARVRELCEKAAKRKADVYGQYNKLSKDRDAIRKAMYEFSSSSFYRKISDEVTKNILTDEQRKQTRSRSYRRPSPKRSGTSKTNRKS